MNSIEKINEGVSALTATATRVEQARHRSAAVWVAAGLILALYVGTIAGANWAVVHHPPIHVGLGQLAPAGVVFAAPALTLRNIAQDLVGRVPALVALVVGIVVSYVLAGPGLALASAAAFGLAEFLDFVVFTRLRQHRMMAAYAVGAAVGLVVDSYVFLRIATWQHAPGISMAFFWGQALGKAEMTAIALVLIWLYRVATRRGSAA